MLQKLRSFLQLCVLDNLKIWGSRAFSWRDICNRATSNYKMDKYKSRWWNWVEDIASDYALSSPHCHPKVLMLRFKGAPNSRIYKSSFSFTSGRHDDYIFPNKKEKWVNISRIIFTDAAGKKMFFLIVVSGIWRTC